MRRLVVGSLALALLAPVGAVRATSDPAPSSGDYLQAIVDRSPAPEYRRFGTAAMQTVATYAADQLRADGYAVLADDVGGFTRWAVDYSAGHEPSLVRSSDGHAFDEVDSAFDITPTGPDGVTCTVRKIADVQPGDCGLVPFADASPEWKNPSSSNYRSDVDSIIAKKGAAVVVQGDVGRHLVYALRLRKNIPAVVAAVSDTEVVGQQVQLRTMGAAVPATTHNVIGVLRPPAGSSQYVLLTAHMDGWYQAAADNGGGAAAVLRAAHLLAQSRPGIGVVVGLFDGEEVGLLGSQAVAQQLSNTGPGLDVGDGGAPLHMADLKADLNLDASSARASDVQNQVRSVAGTDAPLFSWRAMVFSEEPVLANAFIATFAAHQVLGLPLASRAAVTIEGGWRTDAQWFHQNGVPVAWPVAGYPEYHTDGDVPSAMDLADLENVAAAAADLAGQIATLPIGPVPPQAR